MDTLQHPGPGLVQGIGFRIPAADGRSRAHRARQLQARYRAEGLAAPDAECNEPGYEQLSLRQWRPEGVDQEVPTGRGHERRAAGAHAPHLVRHRPPEDRDGTEAW